MRKTFFTEMFGYEWRQRKNEENEKLNLISHRKAKTEIKFWLTLPLMPPFPSRTPMSLQFSQISPNDVEFIGALVSTFSTISTPIIKPCE